MSSKELFIHGERDVLFTKEEDLFFSHTTLHLLANSLITSIPRLEYLIVFKNLDFNGDYMIGLINATHILIHIAHEDDY